MGSLTLPRCFGHCRPRSMTACNRANASAGFFHRWVDIYWVDIYWVDTYPAIH